MTPEDVRHYATFGFVWVRDCFHQGEVSTLLSEAAKAHAEGWAEPHVVEESAALTQLLVRDGRITGRAKQLLGEECIWSGSELHGASKVRSPNPRPSRQPLPTPPHRPCRARRYRSTHAAASASATTTPSTPGTLTAPARES